MKHANKYQRTYFNVENAPMRWIKKDYIDHAPIWCSVDLRDGNQSLIIPMSLEEKLEFFKMLVKVGFKEIEVGFPAASETEYEFLRALIDQNLIPDDVTIQVLTQAREHIIRKTFDALKGAKKAIVHLYNSTSVAQREQVFKKSKEEIIQIAVDGAKLIKSIADETKGNYQFEYSPESFTQTEMDFAADICNAVIDVLKPTPENKVIINLPVTVQVSMPHVYANQIEYMCDHLHERENIIVSLHPHNDRGCGVADSEMGLLAGADRIEGTLFGNGERTGNVDIITLAMNMYSQGVEPNLDFTNIPEIIEVYERVTRMHVYERSPYSGELVFAAFSGGHQDAIAKGMKWREEKQLDTWTVPYLPVDPQDVGRQYDGGVIRINSQSGKGGIGYLLEQKYGYDTPKEMREDIGYLMKGISDHRHQELKSDEILEIFKQEYFNKTMPIHMLDYHFVRTNEVMVTLTIEMNGEKRDIVGRGNGRLDAVSNAITSSLNINYKDLLYKEHALTKGSTSQAVAYVGIHDEKGLMYWGAGIHDDIIAASVIALFSAVNRLMGGK